MADFPNDDNWKLLRTLTSANGTFADDPDWAGVAALAIPAADTAPLYRSSTPGMDGPADSVFFYWVMKNASGAVIDRAAAVATTQGILVTQANLRDADGNVTREEFHKIDSVPSADPLPPNRGSYLTVRGADRFTVRLTSITAVAAARSIEIWYRQE